VYDVGEAEGHFFLSMELVDGENLASLLRRIGRLPPDKALDIARQLCAGLAAAHEKGVLHRDLKPANVMLDGQGNVRITDFGLAGLAESLR
jgi:serine/threonine-protein kinase